MRATIDVSRLDAKIMDGRRTVGAEPSKYSREPGNHVRRAVMFHQWTTIAVKVTVGVAVAWAASRDRLPHDDLLPTTMDTPIVPNRDRSVVAVRARISIGFRPARRGACFSGPCY